MNTFAKHKMEQLRQSKIIKFYKIIILTILITFFFALLSSCSSASRFNALLSDGQYEQAYQMYLDNKDDEEITNILSAAIETKLNEYAVGTISYQDADALLGLFNYKDTVSKLDDLNKSKQHFAEAKKRLEAGEYLEAIRLFGEVSEGDTENYQKSQEKQLEIAENIWPQIESEIESLLDSGEYNEAYQKLNEFPTQFIDQTNVNQVLNTIVQKAYMPIKNEVNTYVLNNDFWGLRFFFRELPDVFRTDEIMSLESEAKAEILPNIIRVSDIWCEDGFALNTKVYIDFTNMSDRTIKQITFTLQGYDSVGEKTYNLDQALYSSDLDFERFQYTDCTAKGPYEKGEGTGRSEYWLKTYADVATFELVELHIEYMDKLELTLTDPEDLTYIQY